MIEILNNGKELSIERRSFNRLVVKPLKKCTDHLIKRFSKVSKNGPSLQRVGAVGWRGGGAQKPSLSLIIKSEQSGNR